jgi:hypothetical protein
MDAQLWDREALQALNTQEEFEENLMRQVRDYGDSGNLFVSAIPDSKAVYDTIICMSYLDRGFNSQMLNRLVDEGFVELNLGLAREVQIDEILRILQKYFFVKVLGSATSGSVEIQLHDEMARLVLKYLWPSWVSPNGKSREEFSQQIILWYDDFIRISEKEGAK